MRFFLIFSSVLLSSFVQCQLNPDADDFYTYDLYEQEEQDGGGDYFSTGTSPGGSGK